MLSDGQAHHAAHVLRMEAGAGVELFDGRGGRASGVVERVGRNHVAILIDRVESGADRPSPLVHLAFAVPKGKRLDWLIEKATELGAASLRPVLFERSVAGRKAAASDTGRDRWLAHCIAAAQQCGLDWLPDLHDPQPLADFLSEAPGSVKLAGFADQGACPLRDAIPDEKNTDEMCLLVGPEGGLTETETGALTRAGFRAVHLGRTTLRVETAAVAMLAAVTALCGD